ncbi:MAG: hypothetical protein VKJ04_12095 [Vampirovibrionales bacterium]|nr:hypothetical protein [Vampirovibrionales bacterium]
MLSGISSCHSGNPNFKNALHPLPVEGLKFAAIVAADSPFDFPKSSGSSKAATTGQKAPTSRLSLPVFFQGRRKIHHLLSALFDLPYKPKLVDSEKLRELNHHLQYCYHSPYRISHALKVRSRGFYNYYIFKLGRTLPQEFVLFDPKDYTQSIWGIKRGHTLLIYDPLEQKLTYHRDGSKPRDFRIQSRTTERRAFGSMGIRVKRIEPEDSLLGPLRPQLEALLQKASELLPG